MFCKRSSAINSIYSGHQLFSYTCTKGDITDFYLSPIEGCGREVGRGRPSIVDLLVLAS